MVWLGNSLRAVLRVALRALWRVRVVGAEHLPERGGALLVSNHVSYADAFLIGIAVRRPVRFLMHRRFFELAVLGRLAALLGAVPIGGGEGRGQVARALEEAARIAAGGELVAIFAEGAITRTGILGSFRRGMEGIARRARVPIVPVSLQGVWGSVFSFEGGRAFWKRPRRVPYPVTVELGEALPFDAPSWRARAAIGEMAARAEEERSRRGEDLARRFLRSARRHGPRLAIADTTGRELTYRQLLRAALALRRRLERALAPGPRAGVMLPPGAGAALVNVALCLAGRETVNLNYTLDEGTLEGCARRAGLAQSITSRRFLEALGRPEALPGVRETLFVEDLLGSLSAGDRLAALCLSLLPGALLARVAARPRPAGEPAAVIFSSGTTAEPKGVVLSHANVASNAEAVSAVFRLAPRDRVLGVLPFFHSFGFTVTLWTPLLAGAAALYHASPLEPRAIARLARERRATLLLGTPAFYQAWLGRVDPADLAHLRLAVAGAQKLPVPLAEAWRERFGAPLLEGFGCTECSPVVSVNCPDVEILGVREPGRREGSVGRPIAGVAVRIVDRETPGGGEPLPPGAEGLLQVRGPNVMLGYLDEPQRTAEVLREGWYTTGDVARLDRDGFLWITDRLARFSKIGGEMVPHGRVEESLCAAAAELAPGAAPPELAVVGIEDQRRGERLAVVHTALAVDPARLLERSRERGLPPLFAPRRDAFVQVAALPRLGSGKLDLAALRRTAAERLAVSVPR